MEDQPASPAATPGKRFPWGAEYWLPGALVAFGLLLRLTGMVLFPDHVQQDLDAYRGLALNLADGVGFCTPGSTTPTAYRPPLYPLLLAVVVRGEWWGLLALHLGLGLLLMLSLWKGAQRLGLSFLGQMFALASVSLDPVLIWYGTYPMTEPLCVALSAVMLWWLADTTRPGRGHSIVTGALFGLCVLSRPTYWIWGGLLALLWLMQRGRASGGHVPWTRLTGLLLGLVVCVVPWGIRNWLVLGTPVLMTTHGGYTLLLANNSSFYEHEVEQPWGAVWEGKPFNEWSAQVQQELADNHVQGEVPTDRYLSRKAQDFIWANPGRFLKACGHRLLTFWNLTPSKTVVQGLSPWLRGLVGMGYMVWWILAMLGAVRLLSRRREMNPAWWGVLALVLAFTLMHSVYWSNMRLRAPIVPALALLAAAACGIQKSVSPSPPVEAVAWS